MKWRDAHAATIIRHGGRMPREHEVVTGDVLVPDTALETDDPGPIGRWRILRDVGDRLFGDWGPDGVLVVRPLPDDVPARWNLWDMRAFVAGTGQPEAIAMGLPSPRSAVFLAEALDRSRVLRCVHAGLVGLSRAVAGVRREWGTRT